MANNEQLIKGALIFGGGFLVFMALKPKDKLSVATLPTSAAKSFDSTNAPQPQPENADVVATAYAEAMRAGEPPSRLTELNKECMNEFGMRCYMDKDNKLIVCDVSGNIIMTK